MSHRMPDEGRSLPYWPHPGPTPKTVPEGGALAVWFCSERVGTVEAIVTGLYRATTPAGVQQRHVALVRAVRWLLSERTGGYAYER